MSTAIVSIMNGVLTIDSLDVTDDVTVAYISQYEQDLRADSILNCLQLGARAFTFAGDETGAALLAETLKKESKATRSVLTDVSKTAQATVEKTAETLEKAVSALLENLRKDLNRTLDPANTESIIGRLRSTVVNDFQRVTTEMREKLDPTNPQSPLSALRTEIEKGDERRFTALSKQIGELVKSLAVKAAAREQRDKSTVKGRDFETAALNFLTEESRPRKDAVAFTGREFGSDQNLIGDFVVEISEAQNLRIVLETKNTQKKNTPERFRELGKAMSNRGAAFGISVQSCSDEVSRILPFGDDKMIVLVPALPDEDGWDFMALGVALECARYKALMSRATGAIDINRLNAGIQQAIAITNSFTEVKRKITAGKTHLDGIAEFLDHMKLQLVSALNQIRETILEAEQDSEAA